MERLSPLYGKFMLLFCKLMGEKWVNWDKKEKSPFFAESEAYIKFNSEIKSVSLSAEGDFICEADFIRLRWFSPVVRGI